MCHNINWLHFKRLAMALSVYFFPSPDFISRLMFNKHLVQIQIKYLHVGFGNQPLLYLLAAFNYYNMKVLHNAVKHLFFSIIFLYAAFAFMNIASYHDIIKSLHFAHIFTQLFASVYIMAETVLIIIAGMFFSEKMI